MRLVIVGKAGSVVHWAENIYATSRSLGWQAIFWTVNGRTWWRRLRLKALRTLDRGWLHRHLAGDLARTCRRWQPQMILFIGAYHLPIELYDAAAAVDPHIARVGWVGDRFGADKRAIARLLHRVYYTDSGFQEEAGRFGFPDTGVWLPPAADPERYAPLPVAAEGPVVFVANATPWRMQVVRQLQTPIAVYGPGWRTLKHSPHKLYHGRLPQRRVPEVYARSRAVLNIRNEQNVLAGLNQRVFEASACGRPVLNDDLPDLTRCFDPHREVLVWRDLDELNALCARIAADPQWAARVGEAARKRVLAEHTWRHRLQRIAHECDLR